MSIRVSEEQRAIENLRQNMDALPFASIIVPVYNEERTIGECIESLLNQDYPKDKYEIIIVDNSSKDNTAQIVKTYPVKLVTEDKIQGPAAARNKGAEAAKGEALAFFDADQIADKSWLRNLLNGWEQKEFGAFGGKGLECACTNRIWENYWGTKDNTEQERLLSGPADKPYVRLGAGNAAYRREIFKKLNGFDTNLFALEDFDLALRAQKELGCLVRFNFNAIMYHKQRLNWESIVKTEYRVGFGRYLLECKHSEYHVQLWILFLKVIERTFLGLCALLMGIFRSYGNKSRKKHLSMILFDIAMRWANFLGRFQGFLTNGKRIFPPHW